MRKWHPGSKSWDKSFWEKRNSTTEAGKPGRVKPRMANDGGSE